MPEAATQSDPSVSSTDSRVECDVVILGGAFSGAATGLLLKRRMPEARVIIVEKAEDFDRKVGESTTEVSSCFLLRVLGLTQHLGHQQLAKQGLRFWFANTPDDAFETCAEMGARYNSRLPGFQVDRAVLDEQVLKMAREAGCEIWRPAKVAKVDVEAKRVTVKTADSAREVQARWIVDASGRVALLARQLGHWQANTDHPVNSLWARFRGVKDWDGPELRAKFPCWAKATRTGRTWATNHLMGYGWWCWIIPLRGGDTSIGLVYDSRLYRPPEGGTIGERLKAHFATHPVGREILGEVEPIEGDQKAYSALAYCSRQIAGEGWISVGDAASFIDPLYSSGLDFCAYTTTGAVDLIARSLGGEDVKWAVEEHNSEFQFCYRAWFDGIYRDKYYYLGDAELWAAAFLLDVGTYHLGPVREVYSDPAMKFKELPFGGVPGKIAAKALAFYNRRLSYLARRRRAAGIYGRRNTGWRMMLGGFLPDSTSARLVWRGVRFWLRAEWTNLFLGAKAPVAAGEPTPALPGTLEADS